MALLGANLGKNMTRVLSLKITLCLGANNQIVDRIRNPLGGCFDERPAQIWKLLRHALIDQVVERTHRRQLETRKYILAKLIVIGEISRAGVNANGQVEPLGLFVDGIKRAVGKQTLALEAAHENTAGAVGFAEIDFFDGAVRGSKRRDHYPAQPAFA